MDFATVPISSVGVLMLRPNPLLAGFIFLPASFSACQARAFQGPEMGAQTSPRAIEKDRAPLVLELDRAIAVLKRGLKDNWQTRDQYLAAFEKTPGTDSTGRPMTDAKRYVECAIGARLRIHQIWDEGPPLGKEVQGIVDEFVEWRNGQSIARLPCFMPSPQTVVVSAGMAVSRLKTKIEPVYPTEALKNHVSGEVVLHATIGEKGGVEALRVISGPALLQQAALDSVRQWTYRPYLLNERPVKFETTINVDFSPAR
jgi:TonB family protein